MTNIEELYKKYPDVKREVEEYLEENIVLWKYDPDDWKGFDRWGDIREPREEIETFLYCIQKHDQFLEEHGEITREECLRRMEIIDYYIDFWPCEM